MNKVVIKSLFLVLRTNEFKYFLCLKYLVSLV